MPIGCVGVNVSGPILLESLAFAVCRSEGRRRRVTVCVSTQVGCAMNCQFCYTGRMGLRGNLSAAQVVEQVVQAKRHVAERGKLDDWG